MKFEPLARTIVAGALWVFSGVTMAGLFVTLAGDNLTARLVGAGWSTALTLAVILLWRSGGWRRWITLGLEVLVLVSAGAVAYSRIQATGADTAQAQLVAIQAGADYRNTSRDLDEVRQNTAVLRARLSTLPADFTSAALKLTEEIEAQGQRAKSLSAHLADLEKVSGSASSPTGIFSAIAGPWAGSLELVLVLFLAGLTEGAALALTGTATVRTPGTTTSNAPSAVPTPSAVPSAPPAENDRTLTPEEYLAVAQGLARAGKPSGYRFVMAETGISERLARSLVTELKARGLVGQGTKST